jgi:flagellar motor switch/type III secretory pathway protein FliN
VEAGPARGVERQPEQAMGETVLSSPIVEPAREHESEEDCRWRPVLGLPCDLSVDLPLPGFMIADLLRLCAGSVIDAHWPVGQDVPLRLNGTLIGWSEFEVVGTSLAVRLTELA